MSRPRGILKGVLMKNCLMIGAGGFGAYWIRNIFPDFRDQVRITGLVDVNEEALRESGKFLSLRESQLFTNMEKGFLRTEADFCVIVIPPAFHREACLFAVEKGLPILSEKPIADTIEAARDIYTHVRKARLKMAVVQNYRYSKRMLTFRKVLREGTLGHTNYIISRFAADYRKYPVWGKFRHEIENALLVEGAIHHFDMIRNLTSSDCKTICGYGWNPPWSSFKGNSAGLYVMEMENGTRALYEGNCSEAGKENSWHQEYYRAECENGALEVDVEGKVMMLRVGKEPEEERPAPADPTGHHTILRNFLSWLGGAEAPETALEDNVKSLAMIFAATSAGKENSTKSVPEFVRRMTGGVGS